MKNKSVWMNFISISIGVVTFIYIFGYDFLVSRTTFFYNFDHSAFLTGYLAFINDSWSFPLGVTNNIYPGKNFSIVWTDSIPIYSIFLKIIYNLTGFKLINPLPIWYFICYVLFSYYLGKVLQLRIKNRLTYLLGIILLVNTPLMVNRMIFHSALSAHWLIVASIYFYLLNKDSNYNSMLKHSLNTALSIYIHPYIFTIIFPIYFVSLFQFLKKQGIFNVIRSTIPFTISVLFYFFGILSDIGTARFIRADYIKYRAEFNSFFCGEFPNQFINNYLWCDPPYTQLSLEGYGYFGLGIIVLGALIFLRPKIFINSIKNNLTLSIVLFFMVLYSFGNIWKIAHLQLFEFEPIEIHMRLLEVFRSTGRYTWAFYYFVSIYVIFNVAKIKIYPLSIVLLVFASFIQLSEASKIYETKSVWFQQNNVPSSQLELSQKIYKSTPNEVLHVLPDERCSFPEIDHYIIALEYLKEGGKVFATRTARLKIDPDICKDYDLNKSLSTYSPSHFVIYDLDEIKDQKYISEYSCEKFPNYYGKNNKPAYCKLKN